MSDFGNELKFQILQALDRISVGALFFACKDEGSLILAPIDKSLIRLAVRLKSNILSEMGLRDLNLNGLHIQVQLTVFVLQ